MTLRIHHIAIIASNYAVSKHFYTEILQLPIQAEHFREDSQSWKLDLQLENAQIELFGMPNPPARVSHPEAAGLRHVCFCTNDIAADIARLATYGVVCEPVRIDPYTQTPFTFFFDPDGLPLELHG